MPQGSRDRRRKNNQDCKTGTKRILKTVFPEIHFTCQFSVVGICKLKGTRTTM